jgi:hypothetical protein
MKPRIKVISFFYNEAALLPFFLSHYRFADCLYAVVSRSTDRTEEMLEEAQEAWRLDHTAERPAAVGGMTRPQIILEQFEFTAGFNDFEKRDKVNEIIGRPDPDHDWYLVVDADEFIWPGGEPPPANIKKFLAGVPGTVSFLTARMWNVYRHTTDLDLDATREPVVFQRRHGVADRNTGENALYQKPVVIRPNRRIRFDIGNHAIAGGAGGTAVGPPFDGAHWGNADRSFAVARRCRDRRDRLSETNRRLGMGSQHLVTEEQVREQLRAHEHDPQVF